MLAAVVAGGGCGPGATRPEAQSPVEQRAGELVAARDYPHAAEEYLRLARQYPRGESRYRLLAAQSYLDARDAASAGALLQQIETRDRIEAAHRELLQARLSLLQHRPAEALSFTAEQDPAAPAPLRAMRHAIRAEAYESSANPVAAVRERIALARLGDEPAAREANLDALWADLTALDRAALAGLAANADADTRGWIDLAEMNRDLSGNADAVRGALSSWIGAHPAHPAVPYLTGRLLAAAERFHAVPLHVALLLPLSGQFSSAAGAIRDGFLAAWYAQPGPRPGVSLYDANSLNIVEQYRKAAADGADFIVGPLEKAAIGKLLQSNVPLLPTLALNRRDAAGGGGNGVERGRETEMIQFGLAPEDEARLAASRARADGRGRALILSAANEWGRRLSTAFQDQWQALGGRVIERVEYPPGKLDFSPEARDLLNVNSSDARTALLRERIGRPLHGGARVREDADVIFMAAVPVAARQIIPQLRFFGADRIPVYASSGVYTGNLDPQADADMNDVRFPDMPWVLDPGAAAPEIEQAVMRNFAANAPATQRLYAFGADACRLIPEIGRLAAQPGASLRGLTGDLRIGPDGVVQRTLMWAQFVDGEPRLLDGAGAR